MIKAVVAAALFLPLGAVITVGMLACLLEGLAHAAYEQLNPWYRWAMGVE